MKLKIELISERPIVLPASYSAYQQALIYNLLDSFDSQWLHDRGFVYDKRSFKLFTYSGILERGVFRKKERLFIFPSQISFYVSSPVDWILEQTASNILKNQKVRLENNMLFVSSVSVMKKEQIYSDKIRVKAISPIENHSTFEKPDGKKLTHYYTPFDNEFSELTNNNLRKKWTALFKEDCPYILNIIPLFKGNRNEKIRLFGTGDRKTVVKGWTGDFMLEGNPEFLTFALDAGLGSRNSQGFGMLLLQKQITQTNTQQHNTVVEI